MKNCPLCSAQASSFKQIHNRHYYKCTNCESVFLDPSNYISKEAEQSRYEEHNNDVEDPRYQKFVQPIAQKVIDNCELDSLGLDFGAGTGPVITKMLEDKGYTLNLYDPFFHNNPDTLLAQKYDYIVSCEVIEHFHHPYQEFKLLKSLLKPNGLLICKTDPYTDNIDFDNWYYKDDPTHVFFYTPQAFKWIKDEFNFENLEINGRMISFS